VEAAGSAVAVLTVRLPDPTGYGRIVRDAAGSVVRIVEERDAAEAERAIDEVNTGILVAPTRQLKNWVRALANDNAQREYYLPDVVARAVQDSVRVSATSCADPGEVLGVNSQQELAAVERIAQRRAALALMEAGVTLADPARIDVRGEVVAGSSVTVDIDCIFEGRVTLGDGVRVGAFCVLRDCVVGAGSEVLPFSHIDSAHIGARARIGPYARLRPGARLDDEVHIGNFVEVRQARSDTVQKRTTSRTSATPPSGATSTSAPAPSPRTTTARRSTAPGWAGTCARACTPPSWLR
jgi:bifunctional UDP-N-acetylglucosamine pyrophosphorylase/glucosamine-1-phosphate N-acetyltransferase